MGLCSDSGQNSNVTRFPGAALQPPVELACSAPKSMPSATAVLPMECRNYVLARTNVVRRGLVGCAPASGRGSLVDEAGDEIYGGGQYDGSQQVGEQGVAQGS